MTELRRALPFLAVAFALLLLASLAGCTVFGVRIGPDSAGGLPPDIAAARDAWRASGVTSYTMTVEYQCFCALTGPVSIEVTGGQLTSAIQDGVALPAARLQGYPTTIDAMYARMGEVIANGGTVSAMFGAAGAPTRIDLDPIPNAIDDELSLVISQVRPANP